MIKNFSHKGLQKFYETGSKAGVNPAHAKRLQLILARLDAAQTPEDMHLPDLDFHALKGKLKEFYSVAIHANWKLIFRFDAKNVIDVDYLDYH